jgi:hypothetical protein
MFSSTGTSHSAVQMAKHHGAEQLTVVRSSRTRPLRHRSLTVHLPVVAPRWWGSVSEAFRHGRPAGGPGVPPRGAVRG